MALFWHSGSQFGTFGSTLGGDFGISGAPWAAIFATRDLPGGPWEQQDGFEVVNDMTLVDLGLSSGGVYVSSRDSKCFKHIVF